MSMRRSTLVGMFCAAMAATPATAGCGFFEALFGCQETITAPAARPARDFRRVLQKSRHVRHREMAPRHAERDDGASVPEREHKQVPLKPHEGEKAGSLAVFKRDKTLRPGDIVATTDGFLEYRGGGAFKSMEPKRKGLDLRLASVE